MTFTNDEKELILEVLEERRWSCLTIARTAESDYIIDKANMELNVVDSIIAKVEHDNAD